MERTRHPLIALAAQTLTDPQGAARQLMAIGLPRAALWQGFVLVVVVSVLLTEIAAMASSAAVGVEELLHLGPWGSAALQALFLFVMVQGIHRIGSAFGGTGGFDDALKLVVWLQVLLVAVQVLQIGVLLVAPRVTPILGLLATGWFFWVLTAFIMALHGFRSRGKVFVGVILTFIAFVLVMSMILTSLGLFEVMPGGAP